MAVPGPAKAARALAVSAAALVLLWCVHFRGGLAFISATNKGLIFNVRPRPLLCKFFPRGCSIRTRALFLGLIGIYAAFKFHNESGIDNLYSLHSWVGLGTICLYGIQWLFGLLTFLFLGGAPTVRRRMLPWHVRSGLLVYVLAILAAELGFLEKLTFLQAGGLGRYSTEALLVNFIALLVVVLGSSVVIYVTAPMHNEHTHGYSAVHKP
ncbi:hypothetical protein PR202_gb07127 [Eleusine coracana subsp. coracana]|uniref:Cytochrome b561 domain-containing protein n=1 Tax=Eleusine coracana subsp. coracana TaxID=191504 RepID=A0AAV5EAL5_ELECO|nr:hypothetical protein PR202_gb07127 [Eleusine coracana subsp. coracana]